MNDELIARLEAATGPDRELDALIAVTFGKCLLIDERTYQLNPQNGTAIYNPPAYTTSIDAALTLVLVDCWQEIKGPRKYLNIPTPVPHIWSAYIAKWNHEGDVMGWGATPALAICIAALRAKDQTVLVQMHGASNSQGKSDGTASAHVITNDTDDWGCEYCRMDGELVDNGGRPPYCPKCDAEFDDEDQADG